MDHCTRHGVAIAYVRSTDEAKQYLLDHNYLLRRDKRGFRVISDMARVEGTVNNHYAGIDLVSLLRSDEFYYRGDVIIYTSTRYMQNKIERASQLSNVFITSREKDAEEYASFVKESLVH
jgi:hypothetical protein